MTEKPEAPIALAAAQAVAAAHGVDVQDAVVLAGGSNALVHLRPAPVVARVMTGTAHLHGDVERWLTREVAVGAFLAPSGLAVAPTDLLPPGPHRRDGLWMTFWRFVEHDASPPTLPEPDELGRSLRALHEALAGFDGELEPISGIRDWLDELNTSQALDAQLQALSPKVFESALPAQAIHGDASISNLLRTPGGLLWNDLEDVCVGPVHWDVASLVADVRGRGCDEAYVDAFLSAYDGPRLDDLADFLAAQDLYGAIWSAYLRHSRDTVNPTPR